MSTTTTATAAAAPAVADAAAAAAVASAGALPKKAKLHGRAFYESIGSPKYVLAPMVDQSEFVSCSFLLQAHCNSLLT